MITKLTKCKTCGFKGIFQNGIDGCSKFKIPVDPEKDFCSWHISENSVTTCGICQNIVPIKDTLIHYFNEKMILTCQNCHTLIGTCHTCAHQPECSFMSDTTEPQVVMRTIRQGMMTMQTQVRNPNLVKKHCLKCKCSYGTEGDCIKIENGDGCTNWLLLPELLPKDSQ